VSEQHEGYTVVPFPLSRQLVIDSVRVAQRKHTIHGLIEVDVTDARRLIRDHEMRTGEKLSFTAFVLTCLGRAVEMDKMVHAYRDWRSRLILFDDVDVTTMIEIEYEGRKFPLAHIVRAVNRRTLREMHDEIRGIQANPRHSRSLNTGRETFFRLFLLLPAFLRDIGYWVFSRSPHTLKKNIGTVQLTAVGMFGEGGGWGLAPSLYTLGVLVGGIACKPGVVDGRIEIRDYLSLTLSFDHDVVDGAPAARFAQRFKELLESGYGLGE
jgi:pyruvate/2-oxoglutarate dehydrogenase complex dihydrolipoamide acyltransferase (E2) component